MRRPRNATGRPASAASRATVSMRGIEVAKQETSTRPRVRASVSSNAGTSVLSPGVEPASSTFVLSESRTSTPRSPHADSVSRSVRSAGSACGSSLKSPLASTTPAGVSIASARLSSTLCATRIGCTRKGPISTGSPGAERPQIRLDPALHEPTPREAERQPAAVDGHRRRLQRVGERADVILVPVREQDAAHPAPALGEVLEVGNDRVDPRHLRGGEEHSRVDQQQMVLPLQDQGVQSELAQAAEWDETNGLLRLSRASLHCLAPRRRRSPTPPKGAPGPQPIGPRHASTPQG